MLANFGTRGFMSGLVHPSLIQKYMEYDSEDDSDNDVAGPSTQTERQQQERKKRNSRKRLIGYHNVIGDDSGKSGIAEKVSIAMGICFVTAVTCYAVYLGYDEASKV